ncbi:hypothetical protein M422DRAFT_35327, partial [Sphaerobolus stellatus SS14]
SLTNCFAHLFRVKDRAQLALSNPIISASIRHIELRSWVLPWSRGLALIERATTSTSTQAVLNRELVSLWLSALQAIFALINSLPRLRTISFHERYQVSTYMSTGFLGVRVYPWYPGFCEPGRNRSPHPLFQSKFVKFQHRSPLINEDPIPFLQAVTGDRDMTKRSQKFNIPALIKALPLQVLAVKFYSDDLTTLPREVWPRLSEADQIWIYLASYPEDPSRENAQGQLLTDLLSEISTTRFRDFTVTGNVPIPEAIGVGRMLSLKSYSGAARSLSRLSLNQPLTSIRFLDDAWLPVAESIRTLPPNFFSNITFLDVSKIRDISKEDYCTLAELSPLVKELYVSARWADGCLIFEYYNVLEDLSQVLAWFNRLEMLHVCGCHHPSHIKISVETLPEGPLSAIVFHGVMAYERISGKWIMTLDPIQTENQEEAEYGVEEVAQAKRIIRGQQPLRKMLRSWNQGPMQSFIQKMSGYLIRRPGKGEEE